MTVKCRVCGGTGSLRPKIIEVFYPSFKPCPTCNGAGELDLNIPTERLTTCKFCAGRGLITPTFIDLFGENEEICQCCKGLGIVERPQIGISSGIGVQVNYGESPRPTEFEYDLAISFAGEDMPVVKPYAEEIKNRSFNIFFADFQEADLWGTNLYETLDVIYRLKARYCVVFLSNHYATKVWTNHERRSAQARAISENREYILPVRLDDTEIPGIHPTIGYLDYKKIGHSGLVSATLQKLSKIDSPGNVLTSH